MAKLNPMVLAPPVIFAGLALMFFVGLNREDPGAPPTGREGGPVPSFTLNQLGPEPPFIRDVLMEPGVKLVNFWASWCAPCRAEHPNLEALKQEGYPIYGINYRDDPNKALAFLAELGNPFAAIAADPNARAAIDWGVAGVPETFVVDSNGTVLLRFAGPVTQRSLTSRIRPILDTAD